MSLKRHLTTLSVKSLAVSRYMPDLLTEVTHMGAHNQGFEGYSGQACYFFHNNKYNTCFETKVSGYSDKPRSPYMHVAHVIKMIVTPMTLSNSPIVCFDCVQKVTCLEC